MIFSFLAFTHYRGDYRLTHRSSKALGYFKNLLSLGRLVRRIHQIPEYICFIIFRSLQMYLRKSDSEYFIVDSFPLKTYENHKSFRARIFRGKRYHGYRSSKKQYFFGINVHMIFDENGIPIEFCFTPGSASDIEGLKNLPCDLPKGSILYGDKAYSA